MTSPRVLILAILVLGAGFLVVAGEDSPAARLGRDVVPTFQTIDLDLDADRPDYAGSVAIEIEVRKPIDRFRFHALDMELQSITLGKGGNDVSIGHQHDRGGIVTVSVTGGDLLSPGKYTLAIRFTNAFNTRAVGLYRTDHDGHGYVFTQFEPTDARRAFPCWDEPEFKIPFRLTLTVPEDHLAISNSPVENEVIADGVRTVRFEPTPPLPTYLLAVASGPLETTPIPDLSIPGRIVTVEGQKHLAGAAAETTPAILSALESYFGEPYPYAKLDLIAVPEFWPGAMENPGAVTYADDVLLVDPAMAGPGRLRRLVRVTAHELAHMWFGDLVTMAWWDDLWLNESFADWMGDKIAEQVYPEFGLELTELQQIQDVMTRDARPSTPAIRRPVTSPADMMSNVGVTYLKGKAVLGMFERWVGPDRFRKGVRAYIRAHAWGNATADDLWAALSEAAGADVATPMASFLEQPGLPLVRVEAAAGGKIRLRQERFLNLGVDAPALTWKIPLRIAYLEGSTRTTAAVVLARRSKSLEFRADAPPNWILPNAGSSGYYRWSVPPEMLRAMAEGAEDHLEVRERIGFIGNLSSLLDAGEIGGDEFLRVLAGFADDPEPPVVSTVISNMDDVEMAFVPAEMEAAYAGYVRAAFRPALDRIGFEAAPGESETVAMLRSRLVAILGDDGRDPEVLELASGVASQFMNDPSSVDPSLAGVALELRALDGGPELFEAYRKRLLGAVSPGIRETYLRALGSFRDAELRKRALAFGFEGQLRPNEIFTIPIRMSGTPAGRATLYEWMKNVYPTLADHVPERYMAYMPTVAGGCSAQRLRDAREFFSKPEHQVNGTEQQLARVTDQVTDCVNLRKREGPAVAKYLTMFRSKAVPATPR